MLVDAHLLAQGGTIKIIYYNPSCHWWEKKPEKVHWLLSEFMGNYWQEQPWETLISGSVYFSMIRNKDEASEEVLELIEKYDLHTLGKELSFTVKKLFLYISSSFKLI